MRLIDADKLIDYFYYGIDDKPIIDGISDRKIIDIIKNQPTAYDVDKVVDELNQRKIKLLSYAEDYEKTGDFKHAEIYSHLAIEYTTAIEIVKQGGVSDDVCEWNQHKGGVGLKAYNISCCDKTLEMPVSTARELKYCPYCGKR